MKRHLSRLLRVLVLASLTLLAASCTPGQLAAFVKHATTASGFVGEALSLADTGTDRWFARHPSLDEGAVRAAIDDAKDIHAAHQAAIEAAGSPDDARVKMLAKALEVAYTRVWTILLRRGILHGLPPDGGVDGAGPDPEPLDLPPPWEIGALLSS